jgi:hypothetical protein
MSRCRLCQSAADRNHDRFLAPEEKPARERSGYCCSIRTSSPPSAARLTASIDLRPETVAFPDNIIHFDGIISLTWMTVSPQLALIVRA